jgi:hypothetical protein
MDERTAMWIVGGRSTLSGSRDGTERVDIAGEKL